MLSVRLDAKGGGKHEAHKCWSRGGWLLGCYSILMHSCRMAHTGVLMIDQILDKKSKRSTERKRMKVRPVCVTPTRNPTLPTSACGCTTRQSNLVTAWLTYIFFCAGAHTHTHTCMNASTPAQHAMPLKSQCQVSEARAKIEDIEADKHMSSDMVTKEALRSAEQDG